MRRRRRNYAEFTGWFFFKAAHQNSQMFRHLSKSETDAKCTVLKMPPRFCPPGYEQCLSTKSTRLLTSRTRFLKIGESDYPRPFLIYEVAGSVLYVMLISTKIDTFFRENLDFKIYSNENGFKTTGLTDSSFIRNQELVVDSRHKFKIRGFLSADILVRFQAYEKRVL